MSGTHAFRADLDGLRAFAVLLVVLFHADVPGFQGGFVGVDAFFVISGYLITGGLLKEFAAKGKIDLVGFWLRRARRLLPAAAAMIAIVVSVQFVTTNPLYSREILREGFAAATYWSNHLAAGVGRGYFDSRSQLRPLLHTWSLSVEEQFYFVWPIIVGMALAVRKARPGLISAGRLSVGRLSVGRLSVGLVLVGLTAGSVLVSAQDTAAGNSLAYYGAVSRAWEFAVGGLLALVLPIGSTLPGADNERFRAPVLAGVAGPLGVGLVLTAALGLSSGSAFPWPGAMMPVLGAVLFLGFGAGWLRPVFESGPARSLGKLSYSWYLWHWPAIVLGRDLLDADAWPVLLALGLCALGPAIVSYHLLEQPLRHRRQQRRSREVFAAFVAPVALTLGLLGALFLVDADRFAEPEMLALRVASEDWPVHLGHCYDTAIPNFDNDCRIGASSSAHRLLVIGDSHAAHWDRAFEEAGETLDAEVVLLQLGHCPVLAPAEVGGDTLRCDALRAGLRQAVLDLDPDVVVSAAAEIYVGHLGDGRDPKDLRLWRDGHEQFARFLAANDIEFLVMHDVPRYQQNPLECMAAGGTTTTCGLDRDDVFTRIEPVRLAEREALIRANHGVWFDPTPLLCSTSRCEPVTADGDVVMQDAHHLTGRYAARLGQDLVPVLRPLLP